MVSENMHHYNIICLVFDCVDRTLLESFLTNAMTKLNKEDVPLSSKHLLFDLVLSFLPHLSQDSLSQVFTMAVPLLDVSSLYV